MNPTCKRTIIALCFLLAFSTTHAEAIKKLKFGKVSMEELTMKTYEKDTAAEAVVLYQRAEFNPNSMQFQYHERIKILKRTGTSHANLGYWGRLKSQIKGYSYNLVDGKIVKTKLSKDAIFEERVVGELYRTRIALPNVKEGSVIEIEFSQEGLPNSVEVQKFIPVIYSAVSLPKHQNIDFSVRVIGMLGASYSTSDTWIYKDLPAFIWEPFLISDRDYRVRMEIEVTSYNYTNLHPRLIGMLASSWPMVTKLFNDHLYFGKKINYFSTYLNSTADSIKRISKNEEELARNAFDAIKSIKWNGQEACYVSQELRQAHQLKSGNSADINLNLLILLRKVGLKAYPVLFSTRSNGKISVYSPTITKFNYVAVGVDLPSGTIYLDASEEYAPMGLIPTRLLGCLGHPLDESKRECSVLLKPEKKDKKATRTTLSIDESGKIAGKVITYRDDYNAVDFKNHLKTKTDHDTYIQELETRNPGWYIDSYSFANLDDLYKTFTSQFDVSMSSTAGSSDIITISPFAFVKPNTNPFQRDTRRYPISFPQEVEHSSTISLQVPEGYKIAELPKSEEFANRDNTVKFTYNVLNTSSGVTITTKFTITKLEFLTAEYSGIRTVYDQMIKKMNESIIIRKI